MQPLHSPARRVSWLDVAAYCLLTSAMGLLALTLLLWEMFDGLTGWPYGARLGFHIGRAMLWVALVVASASWVRRRVLHR